VGIGRYNDAHLPVFFYLFFPEEGCIAWDGQQEHAHHTFIEGRLRLSSFSGRELLCEGFFGEAFESLASPAFLVSYFLLLEGKANHQINLHDFSFLFREKSFRDFRSLESYKVIYS